MSNPQNLPSTSTVRANKWLQAILNPDASVDLETTHTQNSPDDQITASSEDQDPELRPYPHNQSADTIESENIPSLREELNLSPDAIGQPNRAHKPSTPTPAQTIENFQAPQSAHGKELCHSDATDHKPSSPEMKMIKILSRIPLSPGGTRFISHKKGDIKRIDELTLEEIDTVRNSEPHVNRSELELEIDVPIFNNPFEGSEPAKTDDEPVRFELVPEAILEATYFGRKAPASLHKLIVAPDENIPVPYAHPLVHPAIQASWRAKELLLRSSNFLQ